MSNLAVLIVVCTLVTSTLAIDGIWYENIDSCPPESTWQCFRDIGREIILTAWSFGGKLNQNIAAQYDQASKAGFTVNFYVEVCPLCTPTHNASTIIEQTNNYFKKNNITYSIIYLAVIDLGWWDNPGSNLEFLKEAIVTAQKLSLPIGIFSEKQSWIDILDDGWDDSLTALPVWYEDKDGQKDFIDWAQVSFGKWQQPAVKLYESHQMICNEKVISLNWRPDSVVSIK